MPKILSSGSTVQCTVHTYTQCMLLRVHINVKYNHILESTNKYEDTTVHNDYAVVAHYKQQVTSSVVDIIFNSSNGTSELE